MASRLQDVILRGLAAARPLAIDVAKGTLYYSTDTLTTEQSDGTTWNTYADTGGGGGGGAHATTHSSGGTDPVDVKNLAGYPGGTTTFLRGDHTFTAAGSLISVNIDATRPGSPNAGDLFFPTDGVYVRRYDGSLWAPWGPIFPFTEPINSDFAWVNQGSSSVDTTNGGVTLVGAATAVGANCVIRIKTAPATPYVITVAMIAAIVNKAYQSYGLCFRDSVSGKLHIFDQICTTTGSTSSFGGRVLRSVKFTTATSYSADYTSVSYVDSLRWMRIADDGTNRICSISQDGQHWIQIHSIGRTDFLTANQIGFCLSTENAATPNLGPILNVLSWKQS